jgi:hypothetical protein
MIISACKSKNRQAMDEIAARMPEPTNMNVGKENYTIDVPEGWTTAHTTYSGINYYMMGAPKTEDDPNTNINVITESLHNLSLDDYREKAIESLKQAIPDANILQRGDIETTDGLKGNWYQYTMAPAGVTANLVSYIFPHNNIAYIVTAGTQLKDAARYRSTFDRIAKSIKIVR